MRQLTVRAGNAALVGRDPVVRRRCSGFEMAGLPHDALNHPERALSLQSIDRFPPTRPRPPQDAITFALLARSKLIRAAFVLVL